MTGAHLLLVGILLALAGLLWLVWLMGCDRTEDYS